MLSSTHCSPPHTVLGIETRRSATRAYYPRPARGSISLGVATEGIMLYHNRVNRHKK